MTSSSAPAARLRTRMLRATDVTPALVARKGGLRILVDGQVGLVRGVRPARFFDEWAEMIVDVDGVSRPVRFLGKSYVDWVQD